MNYDQTTLKTCKTDREEKGMKSSIKVKAKKAFTLIELIFVVVVIAGLIAIAVGKIMNNSKATKMSNIVNNDIAQIVKAANSWKQNDEKSTGDFSQLTTSSLCPYLPNNMSCSSDGSKIYSSGYHTKAGGGVGTSRIYYQVISDKKSVSGDSFKMFADATSLAGAEHWEDKMKEKFEKVAGSLMKRNSVQPQNASIDYKAKGLGDADANFTEGGNSADAMVGTHYIMQ